MILFDFDGVFVDTLDAIRSLAYKFDKVELSVEEFKSLFDGHIFENPRRAELRSFDDPVLKKGFYDGYSDSLPSHQIKSGIEDVIANLSRMHDLHIVTSGDQESISRYLEQQNLRQHFKEVLGWQVSESKVEKFRILGINEENAKEHIFITDTLGDLEQANKIGLPAIGVTWGFHEEERLRRGNPYAIVNTPAELLALIKEWSTL
jgi:phosphoglycolate phosphatase